MLQGTRPGGYACSEAGELDSAGNATSVALGELAQLAEQYRFQIKVVVVHAYQDLSGDFRVAEATITSPLPKTAGCVRTGGKFRNEHYYPYDGHFNGIPTLAAAWHFSRCWRYLSEEWHDDRVRLRIMDTISDVGWQ